MMDGSLGSRAIGVEDLLRRDKHDCFQEVVDGLFEVVDRKDIILLLVCAPSAMRARGGGNEVALRYSKGIGGAMGSK